MRLGSAFQSKFSKRLEDNLVLNRNYFPGVDLNSFDEEAKNSIIKEIEVLGCLRRNCKVAHRSKIWVYTAYVYYKKLLNKLENTPYHQMELKE
jgi:hypothetical protein